MPFPFYPIGAVIAGAILAAALTLFVAAMLAMDRAVSRATGLVVSGLVTGIRGWSETRTRAEIPDRKAVGSPAGPPAEPAAAVPVTRVHRSRA